MPVVNGCRKQDYVVLIVVGLTRHSPEWPQTGRDVFGKFT